MKLRPNAPIFSGDAVGMNQKVILERDDPRQLSATIAPIPPPPTAEIIAEKRSRVSTEDMDTTIDYTSHYGWYMRVRFFCFYVIG
jgi:hypothetical protein